MCLSEWLNSRSPPKSVLMKAEWGRPCSCSCALNVPQTLPASHSVRISVGARGKAAQKAVGVGRQCPVKGTDECF